MKDVNLDDERPEKDLAPLLAVRLTGEQRRRLAQWADEAGLPVSAYVRQRLGLEVTVQPAPHLPPSDFTPKVALEKTRLEPIFIDRQIEGVKEAYLAEATPDHPGLVIPTAEEDFDRAAEGIVAELLTPVTSQDVIDHAVKVISDGRVDLAQIRQKADEVISAPDYLALTDKGPKVSAIAEPLVVHTREPEKLTAADFAEPKHRHKRASKIATEFDKGTKVEVWACACGKEMR
jgi:hypothetical protein